MKNLINGIMIIIYGFLLQMAAILTKTIRNCCGTFLRVSVKLGRSLNVEFQNFSPVSLILPENCVNYIRVNYVIIILFIIAGNYIGN